MLSLQIAASDHSPKFGISQDRRSLPSSRLPLRVVCSSRNPGTPRGPLWKGRVLSNEAVRAVQELKRAKGDGDRVASVFNTKITRLLKPDMVAVLGELQRQDECELALQVFEVIRKEIWYKPDVALYSVIIAALGRNNMVEEVDRLFTISQEEGLQPHPRFCSEVVCAYLRTGNSKRAVELYDQFKKERFLPCQVTYGILLKGLQRNGELDLAAAVQKEYKEALEAGLVENALIS